MLLPTVEQEFSYIPLKPGHEAYYIVPQNLILGKDR